MLIKGSGRARVLNHSIFESWRLEGLQKSIRRIARYHRKFSKDVPSMFMQVLGRYGDIPIRQSKRASHRLRTRMGPKIAQNIIMTSTTLRQQPVSLVQPSSHDFRREALAIEPLSEFIRLPRQVLEQKGRFKNTADLPY